MPLSPSAFKTRYYNIPVDGVQQGSYFTVNKYRSGDVVKKSPASHVYFELLSYLKKSKKYTGATHNLSEGILPGSKLHGAFNGKASVETCSLVLQLAGHYLENTKDSMPYESFGWAHNNVSLQDFADWYFGLDCNGFVGNFYSYAFPGSGIGPSTSCNEFDLASRHPLIRQGIDEICPFDVLVREGDAGVRHVALIEDIWPNDGNTATIRLVQSGGGHPGLSDEYETLVWLGAPKKNDRSVLSVRIKGHMSFNYVIGYPCAQASWPEDEY
jgi:hypothetical protein